MTIKIHTNTNYWIMIVVFYLLLFQNALGELFEGFGYIDELFAFAGFAIICYQAVKRGKLRISKNTEGIVIPLLVFFVIGILGNLIFRYQPLAAVLIDIYTNLKFFLSIVTGYYLIRNINEWRGSEGLIFHAKAMTLVLFLLLLADQLFGTFESPGQRYGMRVTQLFYGHPTYLAGAAVFLLSVLTVFYGKKNNPFIAMALCFLFFTLRGKAVAGAAIYCLIFYFIVLYRKKLKFWHICLIVLVALAVAGEQFAYYYLELEGTSARSALTLTSFEILKDYFPIGTGFGTYASSQASEHYSPVYIKYGLYDIHGLSASGASFGSDTFWPIIIGQTGFIGTICFIVVIGMLFLRILRVRKISIPAYAAGIFMFMYLMISSTSEPAFHNSISIPLAMLLGYILSLEDKAKKGETL